MIDTEEEYAAAALHKQELREKLQAGATDVEACDRFADEMHDIRKKCQLDPESEGSKVGRYHPQQSMERQPWQPWHP